MVLDFTLSTGVTTFSSLSTLALPVSPSTSWSIPCNVESLTLDKASATLCKVPSEMVGFDSLTTVLFDTLLLSTSHSMSPSCSMSAVSNSTESISPSSTATFGSVFSSQPLSKSSSASPGGKLLCVFSLPPLTLVPRTQVDCWLDIFTNKFASFRKYAFSSSLSEVLILGMLSWARSSLYLTSTFDSTPRQLPIIEIRFCSFFWAVSRSSRALISSSCWLAISAFLASISFCFWQLSFLKLDCVSKWL